MGEGFTYYCKKCHHSYSVMLGSGMMFPIEYMEEVGKITDGVYGDEWRDLFQKTPAKCFIFAITAEDGKSGRISRSTSRKIPMRTGGSFRM